MKSKRRQELRSNDLAHALEQLSSSFKDWGAYIIGGLAIVFVGVIIFTYMKSARQTAQDESFAQLQKELSPATTGVPKSNEELLRSISRVTELAEQSNDADFKIESTIERGDFALSMAVSGPEGIDLELLKEAKKAFEEIVRDHRDLPIHYGRALFGLFQVEANAFAIDADPARKATAEDYLQKLRDDPRLAGVPFQTMAIDRLNELDDIFTKVEFPKQPASAVQALISPTAISPSAPSSTVTLGTGSAGGAGSAGEAGAPDSDVEIEKDEAADTEGADTEVTEKEVTEGSADGDPADDSTGTDPDSAEGDDNSGDDDSGGDDSANGNED